MQDAAPLEDEEKILVDQLKQIYFNKSHETWTLSVYNRSTKWPVYWNVKSVHKLCV